jgi:hypothetical protein
MRTLARVAERFFLSEREGTAAEAYHFGASHAHAELTACKPATGSVTGAGEGAALTQPSCYPGFTGLYPHCSSNFRSLADAAAPTPLCSCR